MKTEDKLLAKMQEDSKKKWEEQHVKAIVKEITIDVDIVHGWKSKIREIYIPTEGIFFNKEACNMIHIGRYDDAKDVGETYISKYFVKTMKDYIRAKESIQSLRESYQKEFNIHKRLKPNDSS